MENILKDILGGAMEPQRGGQSQSGDPMLDMLGSILGGMGAPQQPAPRQQAASDPLSDLIGGVLGGNQSAPQGSGTLMDILGMVLGGQGGRGRSQAAATNPIANLLAEKLGIPPFIAQMVVSYFMAKLLSGQMGGASDSGFQSGRGAGGGLDLDHLLGDVDDDQALANNLINSGMPQELAQHAGIDQETAMRSLQEMLKIVAGETRTPKPVTTQEAGLKGLLDNWETD